MSNNITKTGIYNIDISNTSYLVNNFTKSGNITGWTLGSCTLTNGIAVLSATNPQILSPYFDVGLDDIIAVEFTISLPTPSTTTSGPGVYIGTPTSQGVFVHSFNHTTKTWTANTTANNNPYFLNSYNLVKTLTQKHYVIGANVNLADVPWGETSNTNYPAKAIQLTSSLTNTRLRSGYNSNTAMVINFSNPEIYHINKRGIYDSDEIINANIGDGFSQSFQFIEY